MVMQSGVQDQKTNRGTDAHKKSSGGDWPRPRSFLELHLGCFTQNAHLLTTYGENKRTVESEEVREANDSEETSKVRIANRQLPVGLVTIHLYLHLFCSGRVFVQADGYETTSDPGVLVHHLSLSTTTCSTPTGRQY